MMYYAKLPFTEDPPVVFEPTEQQLQTAGTQILAFIGDGKKSYDEIENYLLVELGYASQFGATGNHIINLLQQMIDGGYIKAGENFYPE